MNRPPRFVIATPICDGHDVAAAAITRILRTEGAEAVYIGFNKSANQIAKAAAEEDAHAIAVSSYNGGHISFLAETLKQQAKHGIPHIPLFAGGGGSIRERDIKPLRRLGVAKIYRPPLDLAEAVRDMISLAESAREANPSPNNHPPAFRAIAERLSAVQRGAPPQQQPRNNPLPRVWGVGGRGGAGKSSLIDELLLRFLRSNNGHIAVLAADPTLGDRIRMLHCYSPRVFVRSVRVGPDQSAETILAPLIDELRAHNFALVLVESVGLGQNEIGVARIADASIFCMTPEYGSDIQLEKEALLRQAEIVVMNKRDLPQAEARAARVRRFLPENRPLFLTEAQRFGDPGVSALFTEIARRSGLQSHNPPNPPAAADPPVPSAQRAYLGAIVDAHEAYYAESETEANLAANGKASRDYQAEFDRLWNDYGFDGDLNGASIQNGVAYRNANANAKPAPVARITTTGVWVPVLGMPDRDADPRQIVRYLYKQNIPGRFPFTEGAYLHRRRDEDPIRMFAGLGLPETTNNRFRLLAAGHGSPRLSTAFDSLTLYGLDSDEPGALAKVGEGGVALDTIDDMLRLYDGFDLEHTSISLTINGPAPTLMALFLAAARRRGADWRKLRGTIQTDILKEVQAQNETLFPLEPSLRLLSDMIEYTIRHAPSWNPISISGYHIGEAGANPVQELAFTLANAFTYIEILKARGLPLETFTRRFSFFFTSGSELEFNVLGRVARRIWAIALKQRYELQGPSLALRFHSQTSGRSLQDSEPLHNLTRVAIQAERALHNNANSLHTNSYKETYTTPEEDDVRLAMGSQQIPLVETGDFSFTENLHQGAYALSFLEDEVERAVHRIFREIDQQGGVLPAIDNEYFRTIIQEEAQRERRAMREGKRKIVGVNYLLPASNAPKPPGGIVHIPMQEKRRQAARTRAFKRQHANQARRALQNLQRVAASRANAFEAILQAAEHATVGQITHALWEVWGRFRPSM